MFDFNGKLPQHPQIKRPALWKTLASAALTNLRDWPQPARIALLLTIVVLAASLTGCATPSTPPSQPAMNPAPPQISEPLPPSSYSSRVESFLRKSRELLTGTPAM